ncbi:MAG: O-antigen ligase family protein, partial [Candidatus Aminicenantes bacterium]|nr:O-antigen ligase family protein [Candidatus Aminicenantes bacterium]
MKSRAQALKEGLDIKAQALQRRDRAYRRIVEYGLLAVIIFSPLPAASVYEWSILVIQVLVLVMLAAYILMREKPQSSELLSLSLKWPRYLFSGLFVFILVQLIPLPRFLIKVISPNTYSFHNLFNPDFAEVKFMSLSLIPSHTLREGLELLIYFLLGYLIVKTVTRRKQIMRIVYVLVIMGFFEAFYGMYEMYNKNPRLLFLKKVHYLDVVTGTFVNRNHLSGYLEMIIPLAVGLIIARIGLFSLAGLRWREKILRLSEKGLSTNLLLTAGIVVMAVGVIFSKSRSGIFLLVFTFFLFFELTVLYFGRMRERQKWIKDFLKVSFLAITIIVLLIGMGSVIERFALDDLLHEGRPVVWGKVVSIIGDYPLFGTGLGTFASVYPAYDESGGSRRYSHAHNDYLEYLSEIGIIGLITF